MTSPSSYRTQGRAGMFPVVPALHDLHDQPRRRRTTVEGTGAVIAHFGELNRPLLEFIEHSPAIVGCVAWITNRSILEALAARPVALVVQKEDWWKRDDVRGAALQRRYAALSGDLPAAFFPAPLARKRSLLPPIACLGYGNTASGRPGGTTPPLMHHKFVIRVHLDEPVNGRPGAVVPTAVWTGSFNFSGNANDSFESAVEIHDQEVAAAYLAEFSLMASLSERMDWRLGRPAGLPAAKTTPPAASLRVATANGQQRPVADEGKSTPKPTSKSKSKSTSKSTPTRSAQKASKLATKKAASTKATSTKKAASTGAAPRTTKKSPARGTATTSSRTTKPAPRRTQPKRRAS